MNNTIDPTYLRAIREGLLSGKLEKENEAELPVGIAELFDKELFPLNMAITEKQLLIHFFTSFALVQKEVTPEFIAEIIEWDKETVYEYIFKYSKWFSGSGNNQFCLYHDRFRVYILQKITSKSFSQFNDKLIQICNLAISSSSTAENESYALECLSTHLYIKAMLEGNCLQLKQFAYDTIIWERQIKASKGFEWSKKMLNEMMLWASKFDEEEVIEYALNKVDLYHIEQNDIPSIVQLGADGDIETALLRIEAFGGNDKVGLQRKFILYMICLMELTLLGSKDKDHTKTSIEKLLKHLDESIPDSQPDLSWNDFFPSYLIFQMASVWRNLNLDIKVITDRSSSFDYNWITSNGPYDKSQVELLLDISDRYDPVIAAIVDASIINKDLDTALELIETVRNPIAQYHLFARLSTVIKGNENTKWDSDNFMDRATDIVSGIEYRKEQSIAYAILATESYNQGNQKKTDQFINRSLEITRSIDDIEHKCYALSIISIELVKQNNYYKAYDSLQEGLTLSSGNSKWSNKIKEVFSNFVEVELKTKETFSSTLDSARNILDPTSKAQALAVISKELFKGNFTSDSEKILNETIYIAEQIEGYFKRDLALKSIAIELCIQGRLVLAMDIRKKLSDWVVEKMLLREIIAKLIELNSLSQARLILNEYGGKLDDISSFIKEICAKEIESKNTEAVFHILIDSLKELACLFLPHSASDSRKFFSPEHSKSRVLVLLSSDLAKIGKFESAQKIIDLLDNEYEKGRAIQAVSVHLSHSGYLEEAAQLLEKLKSEKNKNKILPATFEVFKILYRRVNLNLLLERLLRLLDIKQKNDLLNKVEREVLENGTIEDFEVLKNELSSDEKATFHLEIIEMQILKYVEEGNYNDAIQRIEAIEDSSNRLSVSFSLIFKCLSIDKVDFAYELAVDALKKELIGTEHLFSAIELSAKFKEVNMPDYSYQLIILINKKIDQLDNSRDKNELISETCAQLINLNRADEALNDLNKVRDMQSHLIIKIAHKLLSINEKQKAQLLIEKTIDLLIKEKNVSTNEFNREIENQNSIENQIHIFDLTTKLEHTELSDKMFATILNALKKNAYLNFDSDRIVGRLAHTLLNSGELTKFSSLIEDESIIKSSKIIKDCVVFGNYKLAEQISSKIKLAQSDIKSCWEEIGESTFEKMGFENAYKVSEEIDSLEILKSFKLGVIYKMYGGQLNDYLSSKEIAFIKKDTTALILKDKLMTPKEYNYILQIYSLNQLFFEELTQEKLNRYNRTLNLQWAIDIKNQLPN